MAGERSRIPPVVKSTTVSILAKKRCPLIYGLADARTSRSCRRASCDPGKSSSWKSLDRAGSLLTSSFATRRTSSEQKIPIEHELRGKTIHWDGVEGDFLWPEIAPGEVAPSATNNDSLVVHLQFGSRSILLPGNAEKQAEREILSENSAKAMLSEVLKIVHYGSKNSTTTEFLAAVRPRFGIISAGEDNPYEHPSPELLERLENAGLRVLRSDRDGAVQVDKWHAGGN